MIFRSLLRLAALCFATSLIYAQVEQGGISGTVIDPSGSSIPKAKVTATNQATGVAAVVETTDSGNYKIPYLAAGKYNLSVEMQGFSTNKVSDIPVLVGQIATIDVTLRPGSVHEEITVTSSAVMVDQVSSSLGYVTGAKQIIELPTGRSPYSLLTLSPGVIAAGNTGTGPIVSGGRSNTNAILFDGQDTRNNSTLDNAYTPPQEAVQEVRFVTNSFSAEYGRSAGGVVVAAGRSGANELHGSAYDYLRNDKLNANSWANNRNNVAKGRQRRNEYGFTLSGPVYLPKVYDGRNKTFFFFNWEQVNDHGVQTPTANVPTALQKTGDFSQTFTATNALIRVFDPLTTVSDPTTGSRYSRSVFPGNIVPASRFDPITRKLLAYYPEPTLPNSPTVNVNWSANFAQIVKTDRYFVRGDQNFGNKNKLFFRYGYQTTPRTSPYTNIAFPGEGTNGGGNQQSISQSMALSDTHTFTPNLFGEFRAGYTRSVIKLTPLSVGFDITTLGLPSYLKAASADALFPRFSLGSDFTALGPDRASHNIDAETTPEFQAHFTWLKGSHAVKTGLDILICQFNTFRPDYPSGFFTFARAYTQGPDPALASATAGYSLASMLLGAPESGQFTIGPSLALAQPSFNWYLQDDYKVTRKLTLNLGMRFEYQTPFKERYNQIAFFDAAQIEPTTGQRGVLTMTSANNRYPSDPNYNWAPRVGLAYTFMTNTVFRAGYGIFYAPGSGGVGSSPGDLGSGSSVSTSTFFGQPVAAPNTPVPGSSLADPFVGGLRPYPNSLVGSGVGAIWRDWRTPMNQMWNANIQRGVGKNMLFEVAYIGSRGQRIWNNYNRNATNPTYLSMGTALNNLVTNPFYGKISIGTLSAATVRQGGLLVPYPHYTGVSQIRASIGDSIYHGFTLRAERSFDHGLMFQASFTGAKLIDNVNERFLGGTNYINPYDLNMSRSISAADVNKRFVANYIYELPIGHGKTHLSKGIVGWILGNWQSSGILSAQTGNPLSITPACSFPGVSGLGCYAVKLRDGSIPANERNMDRWFDTTAYVNPPAYSFGAGARTEPNLRNPGTFAFDSVMSRWQPIRERMRLQYRAEFYNLFNHPNLGAPTTGITSSTFGRITSKAGNRTMAMALRLEF
ncbi:MAG: TonB-dependent receptor [Acidobacteria bacterium]|nr:TonB-dependent receptor [Acidobacteriota bacterium]